MRPEKALRMRMEWMLACMLLADRVAMRRNCTKKKRRKR